MSILNFRTPICAKKSKLLKFNDADKYSRAQS